MLQDRLHGLNLPRSILGPRQPIVTLGPYNSTYHQILEGWLLLIS